MGGRVAGVRKTLTASRGRAQMNGADFILLINMTVAGPFAFAFLGIAVCARDNAAAPVFAFGFIFAMLYFLTELAMPSIPNPRIGYMLAFASYYLA